MNQEEKPSILRKPGISPIERKLWIRDNFYIAGATNCYIGEYYIYADFFVNLVEKKKVKIWRPKLFNPLHIKEIEQQKRINEIYIMEREVNPSEWNFVYWLLSDIRRKYDDSPTQDEGVKLFGPLHKILCKLGIQEGLSGYKT